MTILCVVCERRDLEHGQVCGGCQRRLDSAIGRVFELHALLPHALRPGSGGGEKVSGTRDAPLGVRLDVLDQLVTAVHRDADGIHDPHRDQTGTVPLVAWLDQYVRDWASHAPHGTTRLPAPTVPSLAAWLRTRLPWACDSYPAMSDFADELRGYLGHLERAIAQDLRPTRYATDCPYCHLRLLYRKAGADYIECGGCRRLWSDTEYAHLVVMAVAEHRGESA